MSLAGPTGQPRSLRERGERRLKSATSGHSCVKTFTPGTAGVKFVSGRSQISSSNAEFGGSSRCRITASGLGELQPNGRTSSRRRFAIDPEQPVGLPES
jgi:hypothetical protein